MHSHFCDFIRSTIRADSHFKAKARQLNLLILKEAAESRDMTNRHVTNNTALMHALPSFADQLECNIVCSQVCR